MKNKKAIWLIVLMLIFAMVPQAVLAAEFEEKITFPSDAETTIAPERNFYVIGQGNNLKSKTITVRIMNRDGDTLRKLRYNPDSPTTANPAVCLPAVDADYGKDYYGNDYNNLCFPDIMWDGSNATNSTAKIAVTENNFAALILGGGDNGGLSSQGADLTAGEYTIVVVIESADGTEEILTKSIQMQNTELRVLSRFSPSAHFDNVKAEASVTGARMYLDPFPGYWSPSSNGIYYNGQVISGDAFMEILPRWRYADASEYMGGMVDFYIYNINATCATQAVEVAQLQIDNRVDSAVTCYCYDTGEPELLVNGKKVTSTLQPFDENSKIEFTRAESGSDVGDENMVAVWRNNTNSLDYKVEDGVVGTSGGELALYGTVAPIQNEPSQIIDNGKNAYTISNMIATVDYTITGKGSKESVFEGTKDVTLGRDFYETGKNQQSIYEFKHTFTLDGSNFGRGIYNVKAVAEDSFGEVVTGGSDTFTITIGKPNKVKKLRATASGSKAIKLSWRNSNDAEKYGVYRSTSKSKGFKLIKKTSKNTFVNKKLKSGKTYYYKVKAINDAGKSAFSEVVKKRAQ